MKLLVGAGGWAYFKVSGLKSLNAYSTVFNFVELNSTFYQIPSLKLVKYWRRTVPADFEFSVRCYKDLTHKYHLEPCEESIKIFNIMMEINKALDSKFLVLQTPSSISFTKKKVQSIKCFFDNIDRSGSEIVWEIRKKDKKPLSPYLLALLNDYNILHCVDLSKESPAIASKTVYSRIFGKGEDNIYQFTDEELVQIDSKIMDKDPATAVLTFHNVRMYRDAVRLKIYKDKGYFPSATNAVGKESIRKVLLEDTKFPITKEQLIKEQGWKVIDLHGDKNTHISTLLKRLPEQKFTNLEQLLENFYVTIPY
jgi:uncharacterized protein YecE (DUF72 family)